MSDNMNSLSRTELAEENKMLYLANSYGESDTNLDVFKV